MFRTCCFKEWDIPVWCEFSTQCFQGIVSAWLALHCNDWKKSWHLQHYGHQGKPDQQKTVWSRCQLVLKVEPWLSQQTCKGKLKPSRQVLCQLTNKQIPSASCWSNMALPNTTKPWHQLACWRIPAIELVPCWASTMPGARENKCSMWAWNGNFWKAPFAVNSANILTQEASSSRRTSRWSKMPKDI